MPLRVGGGKYLLSYWNKAEGAVVTGKLGDARNMRHFPGEASGTEQNQPRRESVWAATSNTNPLNS